MIYNYIIYMINIYIYIYISIYLFSPAWSVFQTLAHVRDKRLRFFRRFYRVLGLAGYCSGGGCHRAGNSAEVTHHMDPVPHVPPEEMGFQHLASEAQQSPAEEKVFCRNLELLETSLRNHYASLKVNENEHYQTTIGAVLDCCWVLSFFLGVLLLLAWVFPKP